MSKVKFYREILNGRLCLVSLENYAYPKSDRQITFFPALLGLHVDFRSFPGYFGPPDIGEVYEYIVKLRRILDDRYHSRKIIVLFEYENSRENLTNAAFLVGAFAILVLRYSAEKVCQTLNISSGPYLSFRDTSNTKSARTLPLMHFFFSLEKASLPSKICRLFYLETFDVEMYRYLQGTEGGDITWVVPGKFIAFPAPQKTNKGRYSVKKYIKYFLEQNVRTVVRCCSPNYSANLFQRAGIAHYDLFYEDCTAPSVQLMEKFLEIAEKSGIVAVHCYAGLGRTGTLIAAFLIKYTDFTALEAVAWLRVLRPGSVIGIQQEFLQIQEENLKRAGGMR